jgi:hypothetical protein
LPFGSRWTAPRTLSWQGIRPCGRTDAASR